MNEAEQFLSKTLRDKDVKLLNSVDLVEALSVIEKLFVDITDNELLEHYQAVLNDLHDRYIKSWKGDGEHGKY